MKQTHKIAFCGVFTGSTVYRFPHTTYPYSSCISYFLQQHPYFLFKKKIVIVLFTYCWSEYSICSTVVCNVCLYLVFSLFLPSLSVFLSGFGPRGAKRQYVIWWGGMALNMHSTCQFQGGARVSLGGANAPPRPPLKETLTLSLSPLSPSLLSLSPSLLSLSPSLLSLSPFPSISPCRKSIQQTNARDIQRATD